MRRGTALIVRLRPPALLIHIEIQGDPDADLMVAEQSTPLLDRIDNPQVLEYLVEALLDTTDGAAWLQTLTQAAG